MRKILGICLAICVPVVPQPVRADSSTEARAVLDRAIQAVGGASKLTKFQAATWKGKGTFYGFGQDIAYNGTWAVQPPDKVRIAIQGESNGKTFTRLLIINGDKGWVKLNDQVEELDREAMAEEKTRLHANWVATLAPLKDKVYVLSALGEKKIADRVLVGIKVAREGQRDVKLYFDKKTGLLASCETRIKDTASLREITQEVLFSDYQEVQGLKRAMKVTVKWDRKKYAEGELSDFKPLEKLDNQQFAKP